MTGGQTAMTLEESAATLGRQDGAGAAGASSGARSEELDLVVIKATDDEVRAHDALMEKIRAS